MSPALRLSLAFLVLAPVAGAQTSLDYCPTATEVILNTNFTRITPCNGPPINVSGGVFFFRNVTIAQGVTVRGTGTQPMVWIVTGNFVVNGELRVDGGDGARVVTLNAANFPVAGGVGVCGGGSGGRGSPNSTARSLSGEDGFGPGQVPGGGGGGGPLLCLGSFAAPGSLANLFAPGGGGGSMATFGDPWLHGLYTGGTALVEVFGIGGYGGQGRILAGGFPGTRPFRDGRADNDFWGPAYDVARRRWIAGELPLPVGGSGGGGGGDRALSCNPVDPMFVLDNKGGGGGGGGGVLVIFALGRIEVGPTGRISADGGNGGGGEQAGSSNQGGGGGGGSGGYVVLASRTRVDLHTHGETFANGDSDFAVTADGGVCTTGTFGVPVIADKYPLLPNPAAYDRIGLGGFGGLGVVQIFVPPGNNSDNTNTLLDDNVRVLLGGTPLSGAQKERYLGWRGFPDPNGILFLDDNGTPVLVPEGGAGDIRPAPILMPLL